MSATVPYKSMKYSKQFSCPNCRQMLDGIKPGKARVCYKCHVIVTRSKDGQTMTWSVNTLIDDLYKTLKAGRRG